MAHVRSTRVAPAPSRIKGTPAAAVRVPTTEDLDLAKEDALLQLRIGRSAHYYVMLVSAALLLDAALVLYFPPDTAGVTSFRQTYFIFFPLVGGVFLALFGLRIKWEAYQLWPWEAHFSVSLGAVGVNALLGYVYLARLAQFGPTAHWPILPWFYPLALAGLALALIGLALTWSEWTGRKTASVASSVLPVLLAIAAVANPPNPATATYALALSLASAAVLFLISGSWLHIIASGTRAHEREVITSGQSKIFQAAEDVRRREEALRFREATLLKREADAEDAEASIQRQRESLDTARRQVGEAEADLVKRTSALQGEERTWAEKAVQVGTVHRAAQDKQAEVALRESEVTARAQKLGEREHSVLLKEGEHRQREVELSQREQELQRRQQGIPESEASLERRRQEIDRRTAELVQRESQLRTREASPGPVAAGGASTPGGIEDREAKLAQLKMVLDEQNIVLGKRARQVDESTKDLMRREVELAKRENGVSNRESALTQKESDATDRFDLGERRRTEYENAVHQYEEKFQAADQKEAELSARRSELDRITTAVQARESQVKERDAQIGIQRTALERLQRVLAERQKALEAREDELALKAQAAGVRSPASERVSAIADDILTPAVPKRQSDRAPSGTPRLDDLLQGGVPQRGHVLLLGDAFVGTEVVVYAFLAEGLKRGEPAVIVTASRSPEEIAQQIGLVSPQFREYEQLGKVSWIDASQPDSGATRPASSSRQVAVAQGPDDHAGILKALVAAAKSAEGSGAKGFRVGYLGLSASMAHGDEKAGSVFIQNFVGILKPRPAIAFYTVQSGAIPDGQVERLLGRMDGALRFKQEGDKTFLSVAGLGEVATREWIECRATNRALLVGSFALERIR